MTTTTIDARWTRDEFVYMHAIATFARFMPFHIHTKGILEWMLMECHAQVMYRVISKYSYTIFVVVVYDVYCFRADFCCVATNGASDEDACAMT